MLRCSKITDEMAMECAPGVYVLLDQRRRLRRGEGEPCIDVLYRDAMVTWSLTVSCMALRGDSSDMWEDS